MRFKRTSKRTIGLVIAAGLWVALGGLAAFADHNRCSNEATDVGVNHVPNDQNGASVGVDSGVGGTDGQGTGVCHGWTTDGSAYSDSYWVNRTPPPGGGVAPVMTCTEADTPGSHQEYCWAPVVRIVDPNTGSVGVTVEQWTCESYTTPGQWSCTGGNRTGAEVGTLVPTTDGLGGGTAGAGAIAGNQCLWVLGSQQLPNCGSNGTVTISIAEGDLPMTSTVPPCALNLNEGPCEVNHYRVTVGGDTGTTEANKTVVVKRTGLGAASGTNLYDQSRTCVNTNPTALLSCS